MMITGKLLPKLTKKAFKTMFFAFFSVKKVRFFAIKVNLQYRYYLNLYFKHAIKMLKIHTTVLLNIHSMKGFVQHRLQRTKPATITTRIFHKFFLPVLCAEAFRY